MGIFYKGNEDEELEKLSEERGLIQFYSGMGKGKTTAAVGQAVRFAGSGGKVLFTQFLKDGSSSEIPVLKSIPNIEVFSLTEKMKFSSEMTPEEKKIAREKNTAYLKEIIRRVEEGDYGLLVLDEVSQACFVELLDKNVLYDFLEHKPRKLEIAMTGRDPMGRLVELSDYITVIMKMRHPYDKGVPARKGIEF